MKKDKYRMSMKGISGITLIALVVTIIVLIILASISIGVITGENNIIGQAINGKEKTEISNEKEAVEISTIQAIEKDKYGNISKNQLQTSLDNNIGTGITNVTEDEDFIVRFIETQRVYNVDKDGNVEYLGKENELVNQATVSANPASNTMPQLTQVVEIIVKTPLSIESEQLNLVYAWSQSESEEPEETSFTKTTLEGETRTKRTTVISQDTKAGDYYLWTKLIVGSGEITKCFGPYAIKDHTTLIACNTEAESTSAFLGNANIPRNEVEKVTIATSFGGYTLNDENCWDVSQSQDGRYLAWYEDIDADGFYEVTIAGEGGVVANANSSNLFKYIGYNGDDTQVIYGIENLDTGLTQNMSALFSNCQNMKNIDLKTFNTSKVTNMSYMFSGCSSLQSLDLTTFNTANVTKLEGTFQNCSSLTTLDISNWNTSKVGSMGQGNIGISYGGIFQGCKSLTTLDISKWDTSNVWTFGRMFQDCSSLSDLDVSNFKTNKVNGMFNEFNNCISLTTIDVSEWDTSNVWCMRGIFSGCSKLEKIDISKWDTSSITDMSEMFKGCTSLTSLDVSNFNTTKLVSAVNMFSGCSNLKEIDVSKWDVTNLTGTGWMFAYCSKLEVLDTSNWQASWSGNIFRIFEGCSSLKTIDLSGITASNGTWIEGVFSECTNLEYLDIRNFDTSTVTKMKYVFTNCTNLKELNISKFSMESATEYSNVDDRLFNGVPSDTLITTNTVMSNWIATNYPSLTNIKLID